MKAMTHSRIKDVRKLAVLSLKHPLSPMTILFLGKRLRDKDDEVRRAAY
jgi:hypothetical protein